MNGLESRDESSTDEHGVVEELAQDQQNRQISPVKLMRQVKCLILLILQFFCLFIWAYRLVNVRFSCSSENEKDEERKANFRANPREHKGWKNANCSH